MEARQPATTAGRRRRLAEELAEDGAGFVAPEGADDAVIDELDYALRPPVHEQRAPSYGAFIDPTVDVARWEAATGLVVSRRPTVDYGDAQIRRFADGLSSWAVRAGPGLDELLVFDRAAGSERDLVVLAAASGARAVQRQPTGMVRIAGRFGVVRGEVGGWHHEPPLASWLGAVAAGPDGFGPDAAAGEDPGDATPERTVLGRLLDFAVHDLGAGRIGSLLLLHPTGTLPDRHEQRLLAPPELRIDRPHDLAPLRHALAHTDGASVFDGAGTVRRMGVRLVPTPAAEAAVAPLGGTRHTSALRYSVDDPDAVAVVVSEDGPVTVMRAGTVLGRSPQR